MLNIHRHQYTRIEITAVAEFILAGDIDKINLAAGDWSIPESLQKILVTSSGEVTSNLSDVLDKLEKCEEQKFMLIEAPPGMGKSALLKEIAHRWSKKQLLKSYKIVLLINLGDPTIQKASKINDLLEPFCNKDTEAIATCSKYLEENSKDIAILIDTYDECPAALQKNGLIADIINRKMLPYSTLIVASRSHASLHLRKVATFMVDILGFTERERMHFIQQALNKRPQIAEQLIQHLKNHYKISSLCSIPFYTNALVYLCTEGASLSDIYSPYKLYKYFINSTICQHLVKHGYHLKNVTIDLNNLPNPYNNIVKLLYKLSLESLNNNKMIFSFNEVEAVCSDITSLPEAINGLGLLQAVQHYELTGETTVYYFLHSSIPGFLAVNYISNILEYEETFWSNITFDSYITLTRRQQENNFAIFNQIFDNPLKLIHLFCSFYSAGNVKNCKDIEKIFSSKIDLSKTKLLPINIECLAFFLTHSTQKTWSKIDLYSCHIQDDGLKALHQSLQNCSTSISITKLYLSNNGLTKSSSTIISDMVIRFEVKVLGVQFNEGVGEDNRLYTILTNPSSKLEKIDISYTNLSKKFFIALGKSKGLKELWITDNNLNNKICGAMVKGIRRNSSLSKLAVYRNPISRTHAQQIVQALQHNSTEEQIRLLL